MPDSFFSEVFKAAKEQAVAPPVATPSEQSAPAPASGKKEPPPPPVEAGVIERLAGLERQLAAERERALSYEIKFQEMKNAQSSVEEMSEKMWAKAGKNKLEEDLRVVREKATARTETLEKRLDEFQKGLLEMVKDFSNRSSQIKEEIQKDFSSRSFQIKEEIKHELLGHVQAMEAEDFKKLENRLDSQMQTTLEVKMAQTSQMLRAGVDAFMQQLKDEFGSRTQEIVGSKFKDIESAQSANAAKLAELEKIWSHLFSDFKELSAVLSVVKGTVESFEGMIVARTQRAIEDRVEILSNQWTDRVTAFEARIVSQGEKRHSEAIREMREGWVRELAPAKEALLNEMRSTKEWQQMRILWERVEEIGQNLFKFGESSSSVRGAIHRDVAALAGEIETNRNQMRSVSQGVHHLEETIRLVLDMVRKAKGEKEE